MNNPTPISESRVGIKTRSGTLSSMPFGVIDSNLRSFQSAPPRREVKARTCQMQRWATILFLTFLIFICSGCVNLKGIKELDVTFTGIRAEWYQPEDTLEEKGLLNFGAITNRVVPRPIVVPASYGELMPMTGE